MLVSRLAFNGSILAMLLPLAGCKVLSHSEWKALKSQTAELTKLRDAQAAQIENLKTHSRNIEDRLMRTEEDLALLEDQYGLQGRRLDNYRLERDQLRQHIQGTAPWPEGVPAEVRAQLAEISRQFSSLQFDPQTGISKLDTDVLFDIGSSELKPGAEDVLRQLVGVLNVPEARDLRVFVAGHTDDRQVAKKPARDQYRDNFHLSSERALAVSEKLTALGLDNSRIGVAGFGPHQPIAPNITPRDRQKNRRVEVFVMAPDVPVIGWTETVPTVY
jgi:chemotaxis protein MotB